MLPKREGKVSVDLRTIPVEERFERTSKDAFKERGTFIEDFTYWYLTKNEFPYLERKEQFILWSKSKEEGDMALAHMVWKEFSEILDKYVKKGYSLTMNSIESQSVSSRLHWHIYKL